MILRSYKIQAFILKRRNYGEADKIITVFSKEHGKLILMAKGIRRIHSRRAGVLELFNEVSLMVVKAKGMDIAAEASIINSYLNFSKDYLKTQVAYQLIELIEKLTPENQPNEELYELIGKAFEYIKSTDIDKQKLDKVLIRFETRILEILGFGVPSNPTLESLTEHIESILEKKLVAKKHLEV